MYKKASLFLLVLLLSATTFAANKKHINLLDALKSNSIQVRSMAQGGLSTANLALTLTNTKRDTSYIKVSPGLHFESGEPNAQDLFTVSEVLLAIAPQSKRTILLQGFCMQASKRSPHANGTYTLIGLAEPDLLGLAERLYLHKTLTEHYAQMFVWAITDSRTMYDVTIDSASVDAAKMVVNYVSEITGMNRVKVFAASTSSFKPTVELFTKTAVLSFHNPTEEIGSFRMYDADGVVMYTFFENRKIDRGLKVYEFQINDMIQYNSNPEYYVKVVTKSGKVLAKTKVDRNTVAMESKPKVINFDFEYQLQKPVKEARIKIFTKDGTLVEEFKKYHNLQPGNYKITMRFMHLCPENTTFVAKLVSPDGTVHKEQLVNAAKE